MSPSNQIMEVNAVGWNEARVRFAVAREYDLGKFLFTVAAGTIGFLFTAEKIETGSALDGLLGSAFVLLVFAIGVAVWMAMTAPPDSANAKFADIDSKTRCQLHLWLALWILGTGLGIWAVFPESVAG